MWEDFHFTKLKVMGQYFCRIFSVLLVALFFSNVVFHMSIVKSYGKMKTHISLGSFCF